MNTVRAIQKLNKRELEEGIRPEASWHTDYRDTAFIYVGGLPFELSEGDIITIFSQYGEPVWIKLARDKETGKSRGFCWLKYEDQRSADLAVDNLGGAKVMERTLRVDHTRYKPRDDEDMRDNTMGELEMEEDGPRKKRRTRSESESSEDRPLLREEIELEKLITEVDDEDPMKASMVRKKRDEVEAALKKYEKAKRKEKKERHRSRRHRRDRDDSRERGRDRKMIKNEAISLGGPRPRNPSIDPIRSNRRYRGISRDRDDSRERVSDDRHRGKDSDRDRRRYSSDDDDDRPKRHENTSSRRPRAREDDDEKKQSKSKHTSQRDRSPEDYRGHRRRSTGSLSSR